MGSVVRSDCQTTVLTKGRTWVNLVWLGFLREEGASEGNGVGALRGFEAKSTGFEAPTPIQGARLTRDRQ